MLLRSRLLAVAAVTSLGLAACTPDEQGAAVIGLQTACGLAGLGASIAVEVAGAGGTSAIVEPATKAGCAILTTGAQVLVGQLAAQGQPAAVTVKMLDRHGRVRRVRRVVVPAA